MAPTVTVLAEGGSSSRIAPKAHAARHASHGSPRPRRHAPGSIAETCGRHPTYGSPIARAGASPAANGSTRSAGQTFAHSPQPRQAAGSTPRGDRKSTRLNSSHVKISYAGLSLKKKKKTG